LDREIEVTVSAGDIQKNIERELAAYGQKAKIDGFRPGKIPMPVLKNKYGRMVLGEVLDKTVQETSVAAMRDKEIRPATQPKIEIKGDENFAEGKDLVYTLKVQVLPTFTVMDLTKIAVEKPVAKVEDKTINEMLDRIAKSNRTFETVTEARPAKLGDTVVVDFDGKTKEGVSLPGCPAKKCLSSLGLDN
jgi:trigger factor